MAEKKKITCLNCRKLFIPDYRNRERQNYCGETDCRKASKAASQKRWPEKPENCDYFRDDEDKDDNVKVSYLAPERKRSFSFRHELVTNIPMMQIDSQYFCLRLSFFLGEWLFMFKSMDSMCFSININGLSISI